MSLELNGTPGGIIGDLLKDLVKQPMNEVESTEQENTARRLEEELTKLGTNNPTEADVDNEGDRREDIALLGPSADNTQILNKINEIINSFNKSLRDYRV